MKVHCTKKLMAKLPKNQKIVAPNQSIDFQAKLPKNVVLFPGVKLTQHKSTEISALGEWHANLILIQRRQCVIFVHDITRFTLFIPCLLKDDFANLDWLLTDVFINTLLQLDYPFAVIDAATKLLTPIEFDTDCNRSVQGTMRVMADSVDQMVWYNGFKISEVLPYSTSANLNESPCSIKGQKEVIWPIKAMQEFIESKM